MTEESFSNPQTIQINRIPIAIFIKFSCVLTLLIGLIISIAAVLYWVAAYEVIWNVQTILAGIGIIGFGPFILAMDAAILACCFCFCFNLACRISGGIQLEIRNIEKTI